MVQKTNCVYMHMYQSSKYVSFVPVQTCWCYFCLQSTQKLCHYVLGVELGKIKIFSNCVLYQCNSSNSTTRFCALLKFAICTPKNKSFMETPQSKFHTKVVNRPSVIELQRVLTPDSLWLPQVLNQGLSHQCTCFSYMRGGAPARWGRVRFP